MKQSSINQSIFQKNGPFKLEKQKFKILDLKILISDVITEIKDEHFFWEITEKKLKNFLLQNLFRQSNWPLENDEEVNPKNVQKKCF